MGKFINKEAYIKRLQVLAEVDKKSTLNENKNRTLGTLIDYKLAADGYTYGIVKENHQYYIKKSNKSNNPNVSDFAFIGGLGNITEYQYGKLSEADKNRNMIINLISETYGDKKFKKIKSKKNFILEGVDDDSDTDNLDTDSEIDQAEEKFKDLESATAQQSQTNAPPIPTPSPQSPDLGDVGSPKVQSKKMGDDDGEMPDDDTELELDLDGLDVDGEESPDGDTSDDNSDDVELEVDLDDDSGEISQEDMDGLESNEIEKAIGKLTHRIRKTELTDSQTLSYLKQLISSFKDNLKDIEIEDRKEIADRILKTVPQSDIDDLDVEDEEQPLTTEGKEMCAECGSFVQYAESMGYDAKNILDASDEEMANLAGGYINANKDGLNDGDHKSVATHLTKESYDKLKDEYGFDDEDLDEYQPTLNENDDEDRIEKINELWGGLKNIASDAGKAVAKGAQSAGQAVAKGAQSVGRAAVDTGRAVAKGAQSAGQAVAKGAQSAGQAAADVGKGIKKSYYTGEVNPHVDKMENAAKQLQQALNDYNKTLEKAGQTPVKINDLLADIFGGIGTPSAPLTKSGKQMTPQQKSAWELGNKSKPQGVNLSQYRNEQLDDSAKIEVQPSFQSLGVSVNESKVRKYIRTRLEEKLGFRKSPLRESVKSKSIKKLDRLIDEQLDLFENVIRSRRKR